MSANNQKENAPKFINGVNVTELLQTINAIQATPAAAKFQFRLKNEWIAAGHTRSTITDYHGACADHEHVQSFELDSDEPEVLLGHDQAPNAGEYLLKALVSCVTGAIVYHAAARGIEIQEIESTVEGDCDLRGFLGLDPTVRNGFHDIRMNFKIAADISDEQLQQVLNLGPAFSPVFDTLTKGVSVSVQAERLETNEKSNAA